MQGKGATYELSEEAYARQSCLYLAWPPHHFRLSKYQRLVYSHDVNYGRAGHVAYVLGLATGQGCLPAEIGNDDTINSKIRRKLSDAAWKPPISVPTGSKSATALC
jgi:hypothetical protein